MDGITGFDNRDRNGAKRAPTNGARVVSPQVVRRCAPSNSRSSGTAALRLRLRPMTRSKDSVFPPRQGAPLNSRSVRPKRQGCRAAPLMLLSTVQGRTMTTITVPFRCDRCQDKVLLPTDASFEDRRCSKCGARYQREAAGPGSQVEPHTRRSHGIVAPLGVFWAAACAGVLTLVPMGLWRLMASLGYQQAAHAVGLFLFAALLLGSRPAGRGFAAHVLWIVGLIVGYGVGVGIVLLAGTACRYFSGHL